MPDQGEDVLGYLKYEGALVADGFIDAQSAATALNGLDHAIRFFVSQERPDWVASHFTLPVRIRQGSWIVEIPKHLEVGVLAAVGVVVTTYLSKAAAKLAENDFKDVNTADLFAKALQALQWFIKIGKHVGSISLKPTKTRWRGSDEIEIPNERGEVIYVPREYFQLFIEAPSGLLSGITKIIETERVLIVGLNVDGLVEEVSITHRDKHIFYTEAEGINDILFPELIHGQKVKLDGLVTRGNEMANSIGFRYKEHILTCYPKSGSMVRFKPNLFLSCTIVGEISRSMEKKHSEDLRPKIIFDDLFTIQEESEPTELFNNLPQIPAK